MTAQKPRRVITIADKALAERSARGRIIVVDDDHEFRQALVALFDLEGYAYETYASADHYLRSLEGDTGYFPGPCCILCDVQMPGIDGLQLQQYLVGQNDMPLILMSGASGINEAVTAFRAGALDFLIKPFDDELLLKAISNALAISRDRQRQQSCQSSTKERIALLTSSEREVIHLVAIGKTNLEISTVLQTSLRTVKRYRQSAMEKLGVETSAELIRFASESDI